ncbi:MAG: MBL fold metallo-hydrolase [Candidatus Methanomethylophilaceae archaeon]|nr:MBL fold metallo-hydrolase [Candidatus Methanomethylophilaceae archaeon]
MRIRWHGHSCFEFEDSGLTVVIDPHDGRSIGIKPPVVSADIVLMTHNHYDHNAVRAIKGNHQDVLARDGIFNVKGLDVEGLPTYHDTSEGCERGSNTMYLFEMGGMRICHCGDLGCIPDEDVLSRIKGVDFLLIPTGEVFTMVMEDVRRFIELVNPTIIIPMHYRVGGLSIPLTPIDEFLEMIPEEAVDYIGNEVDVFPDDLSEIKECWVFDR